MCFVPLHSVGEANLKAELTIYFTLEELELQNSHPQGEKDLVWWTKAT